MSDELQQYRDWVRAELAKMDIEQPGGTSFDGVHRELDSLRSRLKEAEALLVQAESSLHFAGEAILADKILAYLSRAPQSATPSGRDVTLLRMRTSNREQESR